MLSFFKQLNIYKKEEKIEEHFSIMYVSAFDLIEKHSKLIFT